MLDSLKSDWRPSRNYGDLDFVLAGRQGLSLIFFENDMRICPSNAKGADARSPWLPDCTRPGLQRGIDVEGAPRKINFRVGMLKMQTWRNGFMMQSKDGFDQVGDVGDDHGCRFNSDAA